MDIEKIDKTVTDISNKKLSGGLSPDTRNRYYDLVNIDLLKLKAGLPEDYQKGDYTSKQGIEVTFKISDDIKNFLVDGVDIPRNASGYFPYPGNYAAYNYMMFGYIKNNCKDTSITWKSTEPVTGSERAIRLGSHLLKPTKKRPIVRWTAGGWGIDPDTIKQIRVFYLRLPATPFRNYYKVGDQDLFDRTGALSTAYPGIPSVDAEWPETMLGDFVIRVCRYAGIELREDELVQFAEARKSKGE